MDKIIVYIYPHVDKIFNERHFIRIVDKKINESLVLYLLESKYNTYDLIINDTSTGKENKVIEFKCLSGVDKFLLKMKSNENIILKKESLEEIQKYILNIRL